MGTAAPTSRPGEPARARQQAGDGGCADDAAGEAEDRRRRAPPGSSARGSACRREEDARADRGLQDVGWRRWCLACGCRVGPGSVEFTRERGLHKDIGPVRAVGDRLILPGGATGRSRRLAEVDADGRVQFQPAQPRSRHEFRGGRRAQSRAVRRPRIEPIGGRPHNGCPVITVMPLRMKERIRGVAREMACRAPASIPCCRARLESVDRRVLLPESADWIHNTSYAQGVVDVMKRGASGMPAFYPLRTRGFVAGTGGNR